MRCSAASAAATAATTTSPSRTPVDTVGEGGRRGLGGGARHGQHGALDRVDDGGPGQIRAPVQPRDDGAAVAPVEAGGRVGETAQQLGGDESGVAEGADRGAVGERGEGYPGVAGVGGGERAISGAQRGEHVGAGVGIGDREHVERVDLVAVGVDQVDDGVAPGAQSIGIQRLEHGRSFPVRSLPGSHRARRRILPGQRPVTRGLAAPSRAR